MRRLAPTLLAVLTLALAGLVLALPGEANAGIVACEVVPNGADLIQCDLCDLYATLQNVINILAGGLIGIGVLAFVVGGFRYITSAGSPGLTETAKKTIQFAIVGIVAVLLGFVIVQTVFTALTGNTGGIFSNITCETPVPSGGQPGEGEPEPPPEPGPPEEPPTTGKACEGTVGGCKNSPALTGFMTCFENGARGSGIDLGSKNTYQDGHKAGSCHYGGQTCDDGSHAVDYGGGADVPSFTNQEAATLAAIIGVCGSQVGGATGFGETPTGSRPGGPYGGMSAPGTNHIHINVANQDCGCN